jgi:hypothetical protein
MNIQRKISRQSALAMGIIVIAMGCGGKSLPPLTEVEGTVLINDQPLPHAQVQFIPELSDFGAEVISEALTDEQGKFRLICNKDGQPGAFVAKHRVVVASAPVPSELRGQSGDSQQKLAAYEAKLKNRPIPKQYSTAGQTPLFVDVKTDQRTYVLKLTR